ncbi:MAG: error-prone polymerase, partial [Actinomycetota bacterium]|nr:error-prone polymerase [Actinomycetota bacterium]
MEPFTHLHVASGYSLRYGASDPAALVRTAAGHGMDTLALTDRDGLYGAVKFVLACRAARIAPALGVDLVVERTGLVAGLPSWADPGREGPRGTPGRGGAVAGPRVTVLALGKDAGGGRGPGAGWARLCRLVSAVHRRGGRGRPTATAELVAAHAFADADADAGGRAALVVLLGPDSEVGRAVLARRPDLAQAVLRRWQSLLPQASLAVEIVCHHAPAGRPASVGHAARMLAAAR